MDVELIRILRDECISRAAANVGEERRFFQALIGTLSDQIDMIEYMSRYSDKE